MFEVFAAKGEGPKQVRPRRLPPLGLPPSDAKREAEAEDQVIYVSLFV